MRLHRAASGDDKPFFGGSCVATNLTSFHRDVLRRVHIASDPHANGSSKLLSIAPIRFRGASAGSKLQELVEGTLVRVHPCLGFLLGCRPIGQETQAEQEVVGLIKIPQQAKPASARPVSGQLVSISDLVPIARASMEPLLRCCAGNHCGE